MQLDLFAFVGVIMLVGLVKKNAIMMIDFALDAQRTEGKSPAEAIFEGAIIRFRPIMMTTMAALMGVLPIALGVGAGSESRRPLGVAVVGGLFFSQFLTLYITPVVYTYMESFEERFHAWRASRRPTVPEAAALTKSAARLVFRSPRLRTSSTSGRLRRGADRARFAILFWNPLGCGVASARGWFRECAGTSWNSVRSRGTARLHPYNK